MKTAIILILISLCCVMGYRETQRRSADKRLFSSPAVEHLLQDIKKKIANSTLAEIFENCFPNTLDTTVYYDKNNNDTFVITGDINAMWLRDSTNQVMPYIRLINDDPELKHMLYGVIKRQAKSILIDTYANAFMRDTNSRSDWANDNTLMLPGVWERKYELDSLAAFLKLSSRVYHVAKESAIFTKEWRDAFKAVIETINREQQLSDISASPYRFQRKDYEPVDTMLHQMGTPIKKCGLVRSAFRPSDDTSTYQFHIPANAMMLTELQSIAEILLSLNIETDTAQKALKIAGEIERAIYKYGVTRDLNGNPIFAYEVDGFGNVLKMDDSNIPSLLSLPYLGFVKKDDPLYLNTRRFVLSDENPYFFKGSAGEGIGGAHIGINYIWPMSVTMRALTSTDDQEIIECLRILIKSCSTHKFMHESFHKDNPANFTREWFAWANSLFGELIIELANTRPHILAMVSFG